MCHESQRGVGIRASLVFPRDRGRLGERSDAAGTGQKPAPCSVSPSNVAASASQDRSGCASSAASASQDHTDGRRSAGAGQDDTNCCRTTGAGQDDTNCCRTSGAGQDDTNCCRTARTSQNDTGCGRTARAGSADACRASSATRAGKDGPAGHGSIGANEGSSVARQDRAYAPRLRRFQPSHFVSDDAVSREGG
jgi:hypothetical protein